MLQTLQKAIQVLDLFSRQTPELSVSEVARALDLPKSTASELLSSLCEGELVRRTGPGRYRLGWLLLELGEQLLQTMEFRAEARKVMQEFSSRWGETMHLGVLENGEVIYVEKTQGTSGMQVNMSHVGVRLPPHCSGIGKVLLAYMDSAEVEKIVGQQGLQSFTPNTITSLARLSLELEKVRKQGYAYDLEEVLPGMGCVAAPIRDYEGKVVAAMSFTVPFHRFNQNKSIYTAAILEATQLISENMGWRRRKGRNSPSLITSASSDQLARKSGKAI
ncbi:MAG TPA: IclR family transcriptional regulator [Chloroflexia bacterium]|nr:IclR family transcriptional regulator [Chloroflexia bacterium]